MILPGAPICIVLGGSWSDLGCSVILECSVFFVLNFKESVNLRRFTVVMFEMYTIL